jgi:excisionase family DNA binding protein
VADEVLTLQQAADELGVHYMTAYRYVRLGQLDAHKVGGGWRVTSDALGSFREARQTEEPARLRSAPWSERLEARLMVGDSAGAWGVLEASMAAGTEVAEIYLDVLAPAMRSIGDRWEAGEIDVAIEHRASGIASRLVGRLGSRCVRRGRSRGSIVLGAPVGERHGLAVAILGDLLRLRGWEVSDLGADTPSGSFVHTATITDDLVAIGISVTNADNLGECAVACAALKDAGIGAPIVVGGLAIVDLEHARSLGADAHAVDATAMIAVLDELSGSAA